MGVRTFVLERGAMQIVVGGTVHPAGILRDIGKPSHQTAAALTKAARAWPAGKPMPPVALANMGGGVFEVIAWEKGMTSTNDYDWNELRQLGQAMRQDPAEQPVLLGEDGLAPMSLDEARRLGILTADGTLVRGRMPRIVSAECETIRTPHANPGSLGQGHDIRYEFILEMDNGRERRFGIYQRMIDGTAEGAAAGMVGMTLQEAYDWAGVHVAAPQAIDEAREIAVIAGEKMVISSDEEGAHGPCIQLIPVSGDDGVPGQRGGILVLGSIGGAGYAQLPRFGFMDAGERAARGWPGMEIEVADRGYVGMSAGQGGGSLWMVLRPCDGGLRLLCGGPAPAPHQRFLCPDQVAILESGACESVHVRGSRVRDFLADFSCYLETLGAASIARGPLDNPLPTPAAWFSERGIDHDQPIPPGVAPRA